MSWTLLFWGLSVLFATVFSTAYALERKLTPQTKKDRCRIWLQTAAAALGMNVCIGLLAWRISTGTWNPMRQAFGASLSALCYQDFYDLAQMLLILYLGAVLTGALLRRRKSGSRSFGRTGSPLCLLCSAVLLLTVAGFCYAGTLGERCILISEFYLPDKKTTLEDQKAYLELANVGDFACETEGLYLSDDPNNLQKFRVPQDTILSEETVLIPIDGNVFAFGEKGGDVLLLSNQNGEILDELLTGDTRKNKSYARCYADRTWEYRDPSPGVYNLEKPEFSVAPGFYDEAFYVELSARDGADIYYTWDGSTPTLESEKYSGKILIYDRSDESNVYRSIQNVIEDWKTNIVDPTPVPKGTVIRAIAVNDAGFASEIATATYFVNREEIQNNCVVSLVADPEDLFGPQGIYVTGEAYDQWYLNGQVGKAPKPNFMSEEMECVANLEMFRGTAQGYLNQHCALAVQGGSTRGMYTLKRFSVFAREECGGSKFFDQNIFGSNRTHSMVLRDGSTNALAMELFPQRYVAVQKTIPVTVFLNGEFWYDTYLQEKYSDEFFEEAYQLEEAEFRKAGVTEELLAFVQENDLQTEEAYQRLLELVDVQSYIDFMSANIYLGNTDYGERTIGGNSGMWRSLKIEDTSYGDGRWRWALYDMDLLTNWGKLELGLDDISDPELNSFKMVRSWAGPVEERVFYSNLRKNPRFREQFVLTFMDMVNTCFVPETVEPILIKHGRDMSYHENFFPERKKHITRYMAESYDLTGTMEDLVLEISDPAAGQIRVNTCWPDLSENSWSGSYFTDYPVTVTAEAHRGYRFVRWEGDVCTQSPTVTLTLPEGGALLRAIYEPDEN